MRTQFGIAFLSLPSNLVGFCCVYEDCAKTSLVGYNLTFQEQSRLWDMVDCFQKLVSGVYFYMGVFGVRYKR